MQKSVIEIENEAQREPNTNIVIETPKIARIECYFNAMVRTEDGEIVDYKNPAMATITNVNNDKEELRDTYELTLKSLVKSNMTKLFNKNVVSIVLFIEKINFINF